MPDTIEVSSSSAKRSSTGAAFGMNLAPPEFAGTICWYEHPRLNARIDFHAKWVFEKRIVQRGDRDIEHWVGLGLVVVQDELKRLIANANAKSDQKTEVQIFVNDCYDLVVAFLRSRNARGPFNDEPHIYQITTQEYGKLGSSAQV